MEIGPILAALLAMSAVAPGALRIPVGCGGTGWSVGGWVGVETACCGWSGGSIGGWVDGAGRVGGWVGVGAQVNVGALFGAVLIDDMGGWIDVLTVG